jgi:flagellar motility protein MotE (MotC chaperone)
LDQRSRELDRRERGVVEQESALTGVQADLEARLERLDALRTEISGLLDGLDEAQESRVVDLVRRVESMRDAQAAPLLSATDPELAVEVLRRMSPAKAGKALAKMNPSVAAGLAERLAAPIELPEGL